MREYYMNVVHCQNEKCIPWYQLSTSLQVERRWYLLCEVHYINHCI